MILHGALDLFFRSAGLQIQKSIQGIEFEKITMGFAWGRTGSAIAEVFEIVEAVLCASREVLSFGEVFGQFAPSGGQIVEDPMDPRASRRIRIVRNQHQTFCPWRRPTPF